jgi:hypothetical protein
MTLRQDIFSHQEKLWVLCLGQDSLAEILPPLTDLIDWFNNQLLTKSLANGKIETGFGKSTLLGTAELLPVSRLLVVGLGETATLTGSLAKKFVQALDQALLGLNENSPWIIFPPGVPTAFTAEIQNSRTSFATLARATISFGGH